MKRIIFTVVLLLVIFFLGRNLNPFTPTMFTFHDETQPARVQQFVLNLKNLQIPPRIAPDLSFKLGFPVFNYYSPFSYWVTGAISLFNIPIASAIKISFLLAIIIGFVFMFKLANIFFDFYVSLLSAVLYIASPWLAVEIFIRGNMAETWFIALLPTALWALYKNQSSKSAWFFLLTTTVTSFALTSHNVLSLIFLPLVLIYTLLLPNKKKGILTVISSLFLSAYFFIPALAELGQTHASTIAKSSSYLDHALCWKQLWTSSWDYGVSFSGCGDTMPFMLGKPQIVLGVLGLFFLFVKIFIFKENKNNPIIFFFISITAIAIFLTTESAILVNNIFLPIFSMFQFPWRFLSFGLFGLAFMAGAIKIPKKIKKISPVFFITLSIFIVIYNSKFFIKHNLTIEKFDNDTLSSIHVKKAVAYKVSEYLPTTVDYKKWLLLEPQQDGSEKTDSFLEDDLFIHSLDIGKIDIQQNTPFFKKAVVDSGKVVINVSYLPYWKIFVNDKNIIPDKLDYLGRPILDLEKSSIITVRHEQTLMEKVSNVISIITLLILILWIRLQKISNR